MQRQLLLDLGTPEPPTLADFTIGENNEIIEQLKAIADRQATDHFLYLWGDLGFGKTHLLQALAQYAPARYLTPNSPIDDFIYSPETTLYLIDDCESLSPALQIAAFNLFNEIRDEHTAYLFTAGNCAPMALELRDDLRSRLCWGLIYQVQGLPDEAKLDVLARIAKKRGIRLSEGVLPWLLTHYRRDMHSLTQIIDELDTYSLEMKRVVTLPLLNSLLAQKLELKND
ncbi:MAG: DnaA regulatory inactivator Hda [Oxalobacter sp.]|nr:DnaA regulatory inactivator Hda [Oxalobacter sp.]